MTLPELETIKNLDSFIAPHVLGNEILKRFLTLQMFINPNENEKLHLLVVGGTGTGKSELAGFIKEVMSGRCIMIQKDTSPAGLRERLQQNPSIMFADEFDKTRKDTRSMLLESMQSGTVTSDKHNDHGVSTARVNITAMCNPLRAELTEDAPLTSQISFSKEYYLLSRFHFVIPVYPADSQLYGEIARKMNAKYTQEEVVNRIREIVYAIKLENPKVVIPTSLATEVGNYIGYMKETNPNPSTSILLTPRMIEGYLSAIKSRARMCGRKEAKKEDFEYIKELHSNVVKV